MQIEQVKPDKPSFPWVVFWFCATILLIVVCSVIVVRWRAHERNTPPYSKQPDSFLVIPAVPKISLQA